MALTFCRTKTKSVDLLLRRGIALARSADVFRGPSRSGSSPDIGQCRSKGSGRRGRDTRHRAGTTITAALRAFWPAGRPHEHPSAARSGVPRAKTEVLEHLPYVDKLAIMEEVRTAQTERRSSQALGSCLWPDRWTAQGHSVGSCRQSGAASCPRLRTSHGSEMCSFTGIKSNDRTVVLVVPWHGLEILYSVSQQISLIAQSSL